MLLHDRVHKEPGNARPARVVKNRTCLVVKDFDDLCARVSKHLESSQAKDREVWNTMVRSGKKVMNGYEWIESRKERARKNTGVLSDLVGKKFGSLAVVRRRPDLHKWECECDCGATVYIHTTNLRAKKVGSGCKQCGSNKFKDLSGSVIGKATVVRRTENPRKNNNPDIFWECKCTCGATFVASKTALNRNKNREDYGCPECFSLRRDYFSGSVIGKATVVRHLGSTRNWECKCTCGATFVASKTALNRNKNREDYGCPECFIKGGTNV